MGFKVFLLNLMTFLTHRNVVEKNLPHFFLCSTILGGGPPVVHEEEDGEPALQPVRGDVDELESLSGLVDPDHREVAEPVHEGRALAGAAGGVGGQQARGGPGVSLGGGVGESVIITL